MPVTSGANVQNTFSFGSAVHVDERTRNKLYGVKCWLHIFSCLFGSAVSKIRFRLARQCTWMKERGISCMALSVGFTYLVACLARQWIKERGIIDMRVTKSGPLFCSLATLAN